MNPSPTEEQRALAAQISIDAYDCGRGLGPRMSIEVVAALIAESEEAAIHKAVGNYRDCLSELLSANAVYESLSQTCVGDKVHEARERKFNAEMNARALMKS